jgi:hypothetical protein
LHTPSIASSAQVDNWLNVIQEFIADKYQFVGNSDIHSSIFQTYCLVLKAIYSDLQRLQAIGRWLI